jgi:hypothetical protein
LRRHVKLELLKRDSVKEDACTVCFDSRSDCVLRPCGHGGFCRTCALQLTSCPLCRGRILKLEEDGENQS